MNDLRAAAQQALEALENESRSPRGYGYELSVYESRETDAAITALRAALAEPKGGGNLPPPLSAEPVQEPIAWIQPDHLQKARQAPFLSRVEPTQRCADFVPLYTAPPQRPLTEPLAAAIESILHTDDLSEEIHQAQVNSLRAAYDAAKSKHGGRNESA